MTSSEKVRAVVEQLAFLNPFTNVKNLPDVPRPRESLIPRELPVLQQIPYVQSVLNMLSYNFLPQTFFCLDKHRSLESILLTSKEILAEALPIRCLEATFVGLYLTQGLKGVDRIPLSFKSRVKGRMCHHIVLVIRCGSLYGALGLSRKSTLMDKPMIYKSLFDLIMEYKKQYEAVGHELVDFKLGLCVSHEAYSRKAPCWRYIAVNMLEKNSPSRFVSPRSCRDASAGEDGGRDLSAVVGAGESDKLADVAQLLDRYSELLTTISLQYERHAVPYFLGLSKGSLPACLQDLHDVAGAAAWQENARRLEEVRKGRSPCVLREVRTKRRAASRSVSKRRVASPRGCAWGDRAASTNCAPPLPLKTAKEETQPRDHRQQEQRKESRQRPAQPSSRLPRVCANTSPHITSFTPRETSGSSGQTARRHSPSGVSSLMTSSLPLLETTAHDMTSFFASSNDVLSFSFLSQGLGGTNFHNLV